MPEAKRLLDGPLMPSPSWGSQDFWGSQSFSRERGRLRFELLAQAPPASHRCRETVLILDDGTSGREERDLPRPPAVTCSVSAAEG